MTEKAYIVANKEQELDVLNKFEEKGLLWRVGRNATDFVPSKDGVFNKFASFPYAFIDNGSIIWLPIEQIEDEKIVYDGRKEEKMDKKYKVTRKFINELNEWKQANFNEDFMFFNGDTIADFSDVINNWWYLPLEDKTRNNRLIAIIQWLNGEDVFEVEEPHKFVVRNNTTDSEGYYYYVRKVYTTTDMVFSLEGATRFDTREEAQEWANSHQVVVEIDE